MIDNIDKYHVEETHLGDQWDKFVGLSSNGTPFVYSRYLNALDLNVQPYYCYKKQELMGALLCILSDDSQNVIGHEHVIYDGLIYRNLDYLNNSQRLSEEFKIQQCFAEFLKGKYSRINLSLHPSIQDIRPFLWINYNKKGNKYISDIRYTSYISIEDFSKASKLEDIDIYNNASVARRQEIRYALKKQVKTELTKEVDKFISFYIKTMQRQNIQTNNNSINDMRKLLSVLIKEKMCLIVESCNKEQIVGSMAVFLLDNKRAYYLFGANDPEMRNQHTGTSVLWDAFYILSERGYLEVDLEGINSPYRGWYKLSFGGSCVPYYVIKFE